MTALVLDAGAFVAVDRHDRKMLARLRVAQQHSVELRSNAVVVAQVWRDSAGRQATLARLLRGVDVRAVDQQMGRQAGVLIGKAGTSDPIDASLVLIAQHGDRIVTSDSHDIRHLLDTARITAAVMPC